MVIQNPWCFLTKYDWMQCVKTLGFRVARGVGAGADVCPVRGSGSGARWRERAAGEARGSPSSPPGQTTGARGEKIYTANDMFALNGVHFNGFILFIHTLICIFDLNVKQCDKTHNIFLHNTKSIY